MQSEDSFYDDIIAFVQEMFQNVFKDKLAFEKKKVNVEHMGCFQIRYKFLPRNYELVFENDRNIFVIDIFDGEGAKNTLYRIINFKNGLSKENIKEAILKLQKVLEQDDICFYIHKNNKLYKKIGGEYKRVMDLNELRQ
ncbi:hypothetical protein [Clostridium omnivorum]|uniref:DUF3788 family protein n=1 Tax=Clostridium omnivorum TaxID=1604902 RepID=A0ABQ5N6V9_9CLOT|nr:hypothetical protein [Clostridium sp. E14]GLC30958.1 hypothetical protein bsdE14_23680 [Clostridium sp. E14]